MVAPAYINDSYVDHELSANLDSTFAFEGPEKLLEIWLWPNEEEARFNSMKSDGLRSFPLDEWIKVLDLVNCKILSMKSSKYMDAYLLSESSLFVFPHKIILKTCGTTTTLFCIEKLFEEIREFVNTQMISKDIFKVFYSRRSFMFPERQQNIHRDWKNEIKLLNQFFINGKSYIVGDFTSDDHWYLYTGGKKSEDIDNDTDSIENVKRSTKDQTFEVLMTDLDQTQCEHFVTSRKPGYESLVQNGVEEDDLGHEFGMKTLESTKLNSIFDHVSSLDTKHLPSPKLEGSETGENLEPFNFIHDAFSFSPCGYSSNSISSNNGGYYYTLHITPEAGWSYASFETNYPFSSNADGVCITEVLFKILKIFKPGKFSVTLINEVDNSEDELQLNKLFSCDKFLTKLNYKKNERIVYDLESNYKLLYLNFEKL